MNNFEKIKDEGLIKGSLLGLLSIIHESPGLTLGEIHAEYNKKFNKSRSRSDLSKRVSELVNMGVVGGDGQTVCPHTGRKARRHVFTGSLPSKPFFDAKVSRPSGKYFVTVLTPRQIVTLAIAKNLSENLAKKWYVPKKIKFFAINLHDAIVAVLSK